MGSTIGIIGAGIMGKGVAERFATAGYDVILVDIDDEILANAKDEIAKKLRVEGMFNKEINVKEIMGRINSTTYYGELSNADYIIENVVESEVIKTSVYEKLEEVCNPKCIYMVNTSCIPISNIGGKTNRPDKVIGVHFMNPVPKKNFAEVIRGIKTSQETIEDIKKLLMDVGINCEVVNDSAGFVSNRVSHLFMNEAAFLVYEGVATAEQVDTIFKQAFGHKMGPLETADLIGIDTVLDSLKVLYNEYEDSKFRACPILKRMRAVGDLGRKSGKGFYTYNN